jgi:outer membrane protein assembly factor BamB
MFEIDQYKTIMQISFKHNFRSVIILIFLIIFPFSSAIAGRDEWQGWRGLNKQACSESKNGPVEWTSSENILWKVNIRGEGYSSPVVSENSVFVTSARFSNEGFKRNSIVICLLLTIVIFIILKISYSLVKELRINYNWYSCENISIVFQLIAYGLMAFCFSVVCWMLFSENRSQGERILIGYLFSGSVSFYCLIFILIQNRKESLRRLIAGIIVIISVILLVNYHPIPEFYFTRDFFRIENLWIFQLIVPGAILPVLFSFYMMVKALVLKNHPKKAENHNLNPPGKQGKLTPALRISAFFAFFLGLSGFMAIPLISIAKWLNREAFARIQPAFSLNVFFDPEYSYPFFLSVISGGFLILFLIDVKGKSYTSRNRNVLLSSIFCISLVFFALLNFVSDDPVYKREIICLDRFTGKLNWEKKYPGSPAVSCSNYNSQATPTPVIDSNNIYAYFGSAGLVCTDKGGRSKWENTNLPFEGIHGVGGSPVLCKYGIVLLNSMAKSPYITLVDSLTGTALWKTDLLPYGDTGGEYRTPLICELNGHEVIIEWSSARAKLVIYEARTGKVLYQYDKTWTTTGESVSTPVICDGVIFLPDKSRMVGFDILKLSRGESPILWISELNDKGPDTSSPVLAKGMLFMVSDNGTASCLDSKTGKILWQEKLKGTYFSSPISIDDRIYFSNCSGTTTVIQCSSQFRLLAENNLPEGIYSTLVPVDGQLFIRTKNILWCVKQSEGNSGIEDHRRF